MRTRFLVLALTLITPWLARSRVACAEGETPATPATAVTAAPATPAPSPPPPPPTPTWENAPATRRSGIVLGLAGGIIVGSARGYPNSFAAIDNPAFHTSATGVSNGGGLFIGGALADTFVFAIQFGGANWKSGALESQGGALRFHLEAFPLFSLGNRWRDVGFYADFGTGSRTILQKSDGAVRADGGSMSVVGFGAFWEVWRFFGDHVTTGPFAGFEYQGSQSLSADVGILGVRTVFYGGP